MDYNSKKKMRVVAKFFSAEVDQTFVKVRVKNLVKVTRFEKVMSTFLQVPSLKECFRSTLS